jgi:hypothetical protein
MSAVGLSSGSDAGWRRGGFRGGKVMARGQGTWRGWRGWLVVAGTLALAGCGATQVRPSDRMPAPLVEKLPLDAGLHFSAEFRQYTYKEKRWGADWEAVLGEPHVANMTRLAQATFRSVREVKDPQSPGAPRVQVLLVPRIEEYAFVTPRDAGGSLYQVTIRYRVNLLNGDGQLIDSLVYTGYGGVQSAGLTAEGPLQEATEGAMRDAGAKFLTEFPQQPVVQQLVRGEVPVPIPAAAPEAPVIPTDVPPPAAPAPAPAPAPTPSAPVAVPPPPMVPAPSPDPPKE